MAWAGTKLGVPEIQDVYVRPDRRRKGVATKLSRAVEREAVRRGHSRISLSVGIANKPGRRLYDRLGFRDAGLEPERVHGTITVRGEPLEVDDTLLYLAKDLPVIRPLEREEVQLVEAKLPRYPGVHEQRVAAQEGGDGVYLFAWAGEEPVAHVYVGWSGRAGFPEVSDLAVIGDRRREGLGTVLMDAAEDRARERGTGWVGLAVAFENTGARAFYERLGYEDAGLEPFTISYQALGNGGVPREVIERCTYLRKRVDFGQSRSS